MKKATIKAIASIVGGLIVFGVAFLIFQSSPSTSEATMTRQEAEKIAQDQFQGEVVSVEFDDGRYEIEIETEDAQYELKIDAETGKIVKLEENKNRKQVAQKSDTETTKVDEADAQTQVEEVKQEKKEEPKEQSNQTTTTTKPSKNVIISSDDASKIAHDQVPNATIIKIELDSDDGQRYYEIEMHTDDQEVEIEIDAYTGKVIMIEYERLEGSRKGNSEIISMDEAKQIALAKEPGAKIIEAKLDRDDGKYYYEIEMETSKYEIEVDIDAQTGKIIDLDYDDRD
ncbi:PepSY domain-containing protein [Amphibacillus indicireducens]|uniref:PepSY domain-containing protein n=1 Tax=Amphibacillus indicireducens TaxID=1076330 RepID=A0ABP7VN42_9BACI